MSFEHRRLPRGECAVCAKTEGLLLCGACKVVRYCSRDHQTSDRPSHKTACTAVKKTRMRLADEDGKLRTPPDDRFDAHAGRFWDAPETRDYVRARLAHTTALLDVKTAEAVEAALGHATQLQRLCRRDVPGAGPVAPFCLIRLGRDQEAYDLLKRHAAVARDAGHARDDAAGPSPDAEGADVGEGLDGFVGGGGAAELSHTVALTLLKVRLLARLKDGAARGRAAPDLDARVRLLDGQIDRLFRVVQAENKAVWSAMLVPQHDLGVQPQAYAKGDRGQMQVVLNCAYDAWKETPDAIAVVFQKIVAFAGADPDVLRSG